MPDKISDIALLSVLILLAVFGFMVGAASVFNGLLP